MSVDVAGVWLGAQSPAGAAGGTRRAIPAHLPGGTGLDSWVSHSGQSDAEHPAQPQNRLHPDRALREQRLLQAGHLPGSPEASGGERGCDCAAAAGARVAALTLSAAAQTALRAQHSRVARIRRLPRPGSGSRCATPYEWTTRPFTATSTADISPLSRRNWRSISCFELQKQN